MRTGSCATEKMAEVKGSGLYLDDLRMQKDAASHLG